MQHTVSDLTVSVEHTFDADASTVWRALSDRSLFERTTRSVTDLERVDPERPPPPDAVGEQSDRRSSARSRNRRVVADETYVGELSVAIDGVDATFETYLTVQRRSYPRLVLAGGGDGENGSFDAHVVVAVAAVENGTVVRMDAEMDIAGAVAAAGVEPVRTGMAHGIEQYFAGVERTLAQPS